jgi:hypothetical protein
MSDTLYHVNSRDLEPVEQFDGGHVKGWVLRRHIDWVRDHCDRDEVIAFFEALPRPLRNLVVTSWYGFKEAIEVDRMILNRFGDGDLRFLEHLGAYSARQSLNGGYSVLQRSGVHEFFRRSALLHAELQDFGTSTYLALEPTEGQMKHAEYSSYSPLQCSSALGFYRECIRLHGGGDVDVWESHCQCHGDETCTFEMSWS